MQNIVYKTKGTCSREIRFDLDENNRVHNVVFIGGCNGNLKGISALVEGMEKEQVMKVLEGITCGPKNTSCPDQLAQAMKSI